MKFEFRCLTDLLLTFNTEEKCRKYLELQLWDGKPCCPHCDKDNKAYKLKDGKTYKCGDCGKKFTVTVGTFMENTKISLQKWFAALYLATGRKKGISSCQLARDLGISQKSAWHMLHRIRHVYAIVKPEKLTGTVEIDETYIGGKTKNMHRNKRAMVYAAGTGAVHMNPVLGMIERNGSLQLVQVSEPTGEIIKPKILDHILPGATIMSDGHGSHSGLEYYYNHEIVNHENGEYVNGDKTTNNIECVWSHLKKMILGTYHWVSGKHLQRYCDEFAYRYNTRTMTDVERFIDTLANSKHRITYKQLVHG